MYRTYSYLIIHLCVVPPLQALLLMSVHEKHVCMPRKQLNTHSMGPFVPSSPLASKFEIAGNERAAVQSMFVSRSKCYLFRGKILGFTVKSFVLRSSSLKHTLNENIVSMK